MRRTGPATILALVAVAAAAPLGTQAARAQESTGAISSQTLPSTPETDPSRVLGNGVAPAAPVPPPSAPATPGAAPGAGAPATSDWLTKTAGDFLILDKIYGVSSQTTVAVGQAFKVRSLTIKVLACLVRPPAAPPDAAAFLEVSDGHAAAGAAPVFRGWIFKSEPGLSGLADPVTDIGISDCR